MDSEVGEVIALIAGIPICDDCLVDKTGLTARRVCDVLNEISGIFRIVTHARICAACLKQTVVHRLG